MNVYKSEYEGCDDHEYGWSVVIAANNINEAYDLAQEDGYQDKYFKLELVEGLQYNLPNPRIISGCDIIIEMNNKIKIMLCQ